ncbi:MAG: response regulator [Cyanobacteria bacterium]|jgi:anaerobic magnesium-protoporphyrin IX monomethyl ester cyclase|nr:response regulator [Cyanobacteria bacterium GSL.Bin21]
MDDIQVIIVESDEATRIRLRNELRQQPGIEIASEATNGETGLVLLESIPVDLAIAPMILSDMDGVTFTEKVRALQVEDKDLNFKVLLRCSLSEEEQVIAAFAAGAEAYCRDDLTIEELAEKVKTTHEMGLAFDSAIAQLIQNHAAELQLNEADQKLLREMASGNSYQAMGEILNYSQTDLCEAITQLRQHLQSSDRVQSALNRLRNP